MYFVAVVAVAVAAAVVVAAVVVLDASLTPVCMITSAGF